MIGLMKKDILFVIHRLSLYCGLAYIVISGLLFLIFGPIETRLIGFKISFTSFTNPLRISLGLILLSLIIWVGGTAAGRTHLAGLTQWGIRIIRSELIPAPQRIFWIDNLRALAIFLMVFGHTCNDQAFIPGLLGYIYSFHMPLFFFISGLTFNPERYKRFKDLIIKKSVTLLLPYFFFSFLGYGLCLVDNSRHFTVYGVLDALFRIIHADTDMLAFAFDGPLWFLPCLFLVEIEYFTIRKLRKGTQLGVIAFLATMGFIWGPKFKYIPWSAAVSLVGLAFYWAGFMFKENMIDLNRFAKGSLIFLGLLCSLLFCHLNNFVSMASDIYGNPFYFLLSAFGGILYISLLMTFSSPHKIISFLGMNTIIILGLHGVLLFFLFPKTESIIPSIAFALIPFSNIPWLNPLIDTINKALFSLMLTLAQMAFIFTLIPLFNQKLYFLLGRKKPARSIPVLDIIPGDKVPSRAYFS